MRRGATRILIVEDDDQLRRILSRHLRAKGFEVDEAPSAEAAATALDEGLRPGIVLLDLNLPGRSGWELLRDPSLAAAGSPPVVVTSATKVSPRKLADAGCAGYLSKPYPLEMLDTTVDRILDPDWPSR